MKKKTIGYLAAGALSLGIIGATTVSAFASDGTNSESGIFQSIHEKMASLHGANANLDEETQQALEGIHKQLANGELTFEEAHKKIKDVVGVENLDNLHGNLDEETQQALKGIHEQLANGELTFEEAHDQIKEFVDNNK